MQTLSAPRSRTHVMILAAALALFALANVVAGAFEGRVHDVVLFTTRAVPAKRQPSLLVIGGSYGRRGIHPDVLDAELFGGRPLSTAWFCDGTSPATWRTVVARPTDVGPGVHTVVLQLAPSIVRRPAVFKELALRRVFDESDIARLFALGQFDDGCEVLTARMLPLYRVRRGAREALLAPVAWHLGADENNLLKKPVKNVHWPGWQSDLTEMEELAGIARDCVTRGIRLVVAEWPLSDHFDPSVGAAIEKGFRPEMRLHADANGYAFIPLTEGERYFFEDGLHPRPEDGRRWCRYLATELRNIGIADVVPGSGN